MPKSLRSPGHFILLPEYPVPDSVSRRDFLGTAGAALAAGSLGRPEGGLFAGAPALIIPPPSRPNAVGSTNAERAIRLAMQLVQGGADTLDAAVEGVKIQELSDPHGVLLLPFHP